MSGLFLLAALLLGGYSLHLAHVVRVKFEGKRWMLPARVYARPLELYVGANVSIERLRAEFERLGYRRVDAPPRSPAQWAWNGAYVWFYSRAFQFWDGMQAARKVRLRIHEGVIAAIEEMETGRPLELVRLEAPAIGGIYPAHKEDRVLLRRDEIPEALVAALLAAEDRNYYRHFGINPGSILRALLANIKAGRTVQGGSTLTQQLVKNFFLTPERSLWRKFNEALMAIILDARYSKDAILEAYVNEVYLGQDGARAIHGFGLASWYYFNRPINELHLPEMALLVGLLKGASYYNPFKHPQRALQRRNLVLRLMWEQGFISESTLRLAQQRPLGLAPGRKRNATAYPAFLDLVKRQLRQDYDEADLTSEGLRIFTTLDPWIQAQVDEQVAQSLSALEKKHRLPGGRLQAAMVVVAPQNGEVLALSGGRKAGFAGFNRALDARRPIGSLVKPVIYLLALSQPKRYHLLSLLDDRPLRLKDAQGRYWSPQNYDKKAHGTVPLHRALALSYNLATVRLGLDLGIVRVANLLEAMLGGQTRVPRLPSLLLGAVDLSPLQVAQIYQVLANGGFYSPLRAIREVTDAEGQPLRRYPLEIVQVAKPDAVYLLNRNLVEVMREGTARRVHQTVLRGMELAGKTGTTNDLRDSWFAGFGQDLLAVAWVGRDDNRPMKLSGSTGALPLWAQVMKRLQPLPLALSPPDNVVYLWVDPKTGYLSDEQCSNAIAMPFIEGSGPKVRVGCTATESNVSRAAAGSVLDWTENW